MIRVLALLLSVAAWAAPVISGIAADSPTRSTVRIRWTTDVAGSSNKVKFGPTGSYGTTLTPSGTSTDHSVPIGGLAGGTTYHFQVCSTNAGETCSADQTFTTSAMAAPAEAILPAEFSTTAPTSFTASATVSTCAGIQSQVDAYSANDGNNNYLIEIAAGLTCEGQWTLPAKTGANPNGTGVIVIRGNGVYSPEGSTVAPSDTLPTLLANRIATRLLPSTPGDCYFLGDLHWDDDESVFSLKKVTSLSPCTYTTITAVGSGTTLPGTCSDGDWFYKTDVVGHVNRAHWCVGANNWRQVTFIGDGAGDTSYPAVVVAANAKGYRIQGIRLRTLGFPAAYTAQLSQHTRTIGSVNRCLATTPTTSTGITFDRVVFDGVGFPFRNVYGLCPLDGANVAVTDSYFNEINRPLTDSSFEASANAIIWYNGPGPIKVERNYFKNVHGIVLFVSDEATADVVPTDAVVRSNVFYEDPCHNANDACATAGRYWMRRNGIELKRGIRWLLEGNTFDGGWPSVTRGSCLSLTPRPGNVTTANNSIQIRDIMVRNNWFRNCMEPASIAGSHDGYDKNTLMTARVTIANNWFSDSSVTSTGQTTGWPNSLTSRGYIHLLQQGPEDVILRSNTYWNAAGSDRADMLLTLSGPGSGMVISRNIYYPTVAASGINGGGSTAGSDALNDWWLSGSSPYWSVTDNHFVQASGITTGDYPAGITWYANNGLLLLRNPAAGDYRAKASSPAGASGADGDVITAARGITYNLRALSITSSGATVAYTAPDSTNACTVEYGTSATAGTGTRVTDTTGSRFRTKALTGLTTGTLYYYRVFCAQMVSDSFTTQ